MDISLERKDLTPVSFKREHLVRMSYSDDIAGAKIEIYKIEIYKENYNCSYAASVYEREYSEEKIYAVIVPELETAILKIKEEIKLAEIRGFVYFSKIASALIKIYEEKTDT